MLHQSDISRDRKRDVERHTPERREKNLTRKERDRRKVHVCVCVCVRMIEDIDWFYSREASSPSSSSSSPTSFDSSSSPPAPSSLPASSLSPSLPSPCPLKSRMKKTEANSGRFNLYLHRRNYRRRLHPHRNRHSHLDHLDEINRSNDEKRRRPEGLPLAPASVDVGFPLRFLTLLEAASTLFESSSLVASRDSSSSLFDALFFVVDVAAFTGVAFFFEPVLISASPLDSSSSSWVR